MKQTLVLLTVLGWMLASTPRVQAGDREWATAGKILTGVIAGAALVHALQPAPVVAAAVPGVCAPLPPPVVVMPSPVVVAAAPPVCPPPVTVVYPAPVVVRPAPVVTVHYRVGFSRGPHRHCR